MFPWRNAVRKLQRLQQKSVATNLQHKEFLRQRLGFGHGTVFTNGNGSRNRVLRCLNTATEASVNYSFGKIAATAVAAATSASLATWWFLEGVDTSTSDTAAVTSPITELGVIAGRESELQRIAPIKGKTANPDEIDVVIFHGGCPGSLFFTNMLTDSINTTDFIQPTHDRLSVVLL